MDWFNTVPAFLSAVASVGAVVAAFISLRISKQAISISESNALASHHASATIRYSEVVQELYQASHNLSDLSYKMWVEWAREIGSYDNYHKGGKDPRPLRHVLTNGSEMLSKYSSNNARWINSSQAVLSTLRFGVSSFSEQEYQKLLKIADGEYRNFEEVFGSPVRTKYIAEDPAFRWVCYQLNKRISFDDWKLIWSNAWQDDNWFHKYASEYEKVKPCFEQAKKSLSLEKSRLAHSAFPLSNNKVLNNKYGQIFTVIDHVIEHANIENLAIYRDWDYPDEMSLLVLCAMATSFNLHSQLDNLYVLANE